MPVPVACACGAKFAAKDELAGKRVKCPNCGQPLAIPLAQAPAPDPLGGSTSDDPFGAAPAQSGFPASNQPGFGTTQPMQSPLGQAPASNMGAFQKPTWQSQPAQAVAKKKSGLGLGAILAIAGGGLALVIGIVVIIIVVASSGGDEGDQVADGSNNSPNTSPQAPRDTNSQNSTNQPSPSNSPIPDSDRNSTERPNDKDANSTGNKDPRQPESDVTKVPEKPVNPPTTKKQLTVADGVMAWHTDPATKYVGHRKAGDSDLMFYQYSWMCELLPHLGHDEVYRRFDFSKDFTEGKNYQTSTIVIPEFINPADDRTRWQGSPFDGLGLTHFVGMSGVEPQRNDVAAKYPRSHPLAGVFGYDSVARPAEIKDGTSNTIMIIGSGELASTSPWVLAGGATIRGAREPYFDEISGFGSRGVDGALVVMADGSVRLISSSTEPSVFRSMCTIQGGETTDVEQFGPTQESRLQHNR
jgi:hypothetical protein